MKEKKKAKEELQRLAEERRAAKEKFEEKLHVIKEKIVDAKSQGKHNVVRLLQDKLKQMQKDGPSSTGKKAPIHLNNKKPKRPLNGKGKKSGTASGAKSKGRKVFDPAKQNMKSVYG